MILAPDTEGVHGDIAVTGRPHAERGRCTAGYDAADSEDKEEDGVWFLHRAVCIAQMNSRNRFF